MFRSTKWVSVMCKKLLLAIFTIGILTEVAIAELSVSQIAQEFSASVVTIIALDENNQPLSLGSGFFIDKTGTIVTNHHVLRGSTKAIVKTVGGEKGEVHEIENGDPQLDLLVASTTLRNTKPLYLGDSDTVTVGEDIVAIGNPAGFEGTVSKGIISGIRKSEKVDYIQITAPISPGSSGGPVFNLRGEVIGVATSYSPKGQNLNFAMPVNYLKNLKPLRIKLGSLQMQVTPKNLGMNESSLVEVFEVAPDLIGGFIIPTDLRGLTFSIRNQHRYIIQNIKILFLYKNQRGQVFTYSFEKFKGPILPNLALQFSHRHKVKNFKKLFAGGGSEMGSIETRILDYEIDTFSGSSPIIDALSK